MSQLFAVADSKIFIGSVVAPKGEVTEADFASQVWTEIDGWTAVGTLGDTQEVITQAFINQKRVRKAKGTLDAGTMENTFAPIPSDPGQIEFKNAVKSCRPYAFKIEWGAGCLPASVVTISSATPGVVSWASHGLVAGQAVTFTSTGALPTGLTAGVTYYVLAAGLAAGTFQLATTRGGTPIATTGAGSGVHTATAQPVGQTDMFYGLAIPGARQGGDANAAQLRTLSIAVDSNVLEV